jgi:hypothetical protein
MHRDKEITPAVQLFPSSIIARVIVGESILELLINVGRSAAFEREIKAIRAELAELRAGRQREKSTLEFMDDLARRIGLGSDWRETYDANIAKQLEYRRMQQLPTPTELPLDLYVSRPDPLGFMRWARHHSRGGRPRNERFMDRRRYVLNPELQSTNNVREAAWANLGPFHTPIYPGRVTNEDMLRREKEERQCCVCSSSLVDKRLDSTYCSDRCRKRDVRANGPRSL